MFEYSTHRSREMDDNFNKLLATLREFRDKQHVNPYIIFDNDVRCGVKFNNYYVDECFVVCDGDSKLYKSTDFKETNNCYVRKIIKLLKKGGLIFAFVKQIMNILHPSYMDSCIHITLDMEVFICITDHLDIVHKLCIPLKSRIEVYDNERLKRVPITTVDMTQDFNTFGNDCNNKTLVCKTFDDRDEWTILYSETKVTHSDALSFFHVYDYNYETTITVGDVILRRNFTKPYVEIDSEAMMY